MFRKENGVTLVALVITIIVLLILAGVTISMVLGDDGILSQASGATKNYTESDIKEKAAVAAATVTTKYLADKYDGTTATTQPNNGAEIAKEMQKLFETGTTVSGTDTQLVVKLTTGDEYTVGLTKVNDTWTVGAVAASN